MEFNDRRKSPNVPDYHKAQTWGAVWSDQPISEINHPISGSTLAKAVQAKKESKNKSTRPRVEQNLGKSFSYLKMNVGTAAEVGKNLKRLRKRLGE